MSDRARDLARLSHDVGKYIARAARNVAPAAPIVPALVDLLLKDLYAIDGKSRASALFREKSAPLESDAAALAPIAALLDEIDALEPQIRAREEAAVRRGVELALEVSDALDALARGARS
jgi:hypothetical protein